ncbi:hypothetical protein Q4544_13325 [Cognatishimia sp. 1_MG-2023]|uniref:hypothetical protein n=1 Tax=Cognatishimia sp. 1_MG-2023 TaxID=3062642 RepID=UPI0026E45D8C|nr:hypothetical protein [Cognatishimia sp. 1_MG-2023]MDO6727916.1 hypothetical protein [Cognatishimia sp. 1_MG-2023]
MDRARRIEALAVLQRIKEHELDGHAAEMGHIRAHQAQLQTELDKLQNQLETEAHIPSPEAAPFLAGFLKAIDTRKAFLLKEMDTLDKKAALIEGRLFETYTEARSNEAVLDKNLSEKRKEEDTAESATLEEIARNRYMRQMAKP